MIDSKRVTLGLFQAKKMFMIKIKQPKKFKVHMETNIKTAKKVILLAYKIK
jgi:hypothetical protein